MTDNVDHNVQTLDGSGTFHGMGIIVIKTPGSKSSRSVPRITVTAEDTNAISHVKIEYFKPPALISPLVYKPLVNFEVEDPTHNMMQMVNNGEHPWKSSVMFLPMIHMNHSNPS